MTHPKESKEWHINSNYLACLSVPDEQAIQDLINKLRENDVKHVVFREPDIDNQITAISIEPSDTARRLTSGLPLALKGLLNGIDKNTITYGKTA